MLTKAEKEELLKQDYTFEGVKCSVGGTEFLDATVACRFGGFWSCNWKTVERIAREKGGNFEIGDVWLKSWKWLGDGTEMPPAVKEYLTKIGLIES